MHKFLKISLLGLIAACASTFLTAPHLQAQSFTESVFVNLTGTTGATPGIYVQYAPPIQASDGNFYGTATEGGNPGAGVVYKLTPGGTYTVLHNFAGGTTDGSDPNVNLIEGKDGNFYGVTYGGGSSGVGTGTAFKMTPSGAVTLLHIFTGGTADGSEPMAALVQGTDGNFYGTTLAGGAHNDGIAFKLTSGGTYTILHTFAGGSADGANPTGQLVEGTDGNFYGTTEGGGSHSQGTIYRMTPAGTITLLHTFAGGPTDGGMPSGAGLVQGTDGYFYGTTGFGGAHGSGFSNGGTAFKINSSGSSYTLLHSFGAFSGDANIPLAGLVEGADGNFYGTTYFGGNGGGSFGYGTIFQMTPSGNVTVLHSFTGGTSDGEYPYGGLAQGMDGNFYGGTSYGGADNDGIIYKLAVSPALAAQVQLSAPSTVTAGASFDLSYLVTNSYNGNVAGTNNFCFATNTAGDTTGWTGVLTGEPTLQTATLTASLTGGTYNYALTCGGMETGIATVTVVAPNLNFTSVSHNFGQVAVGTAAAAYGIGITNSGTTAYPFSLDFTPSNGFTSANSCGSSIAVGKSCELVFYFTPGATGPASTTWSLAPEDGFTYGPSNGGTLSGSGQVAGGVALTTPGHNFGTVAVGTQSPTYGAELSNSTASAVTLTKGSVSAPFTSITNCGTTLAAGASCEIEFYFKPSTTSVVQQVYTLSASGVTITSNGSPLPNGGITLTGN